MIAWRAQAFETGAGEFDRNVYEYTDRIACGSEGEANLSENLGRRGWPDRNQSTTHARGRMATLTGYDGPSRASAGPQ